MQKEEIVIVVPIYKKQLSDLEKIEAEYPQLRFWGIEVNSPKYHAHIEDNDVYINLLQPDLDWLKSYSPCIWG